MKRETIDTLTELANTVRSMGTVESHRLDAAIEDLEQELLKSEVWIPAEGVLVFGGDDLPYISSGRINLDGCLLVEGPQGGERLRNWRPIPNITQWTDHDGSANCPCEDRPGYTMGEDGQIETWNNSQNASWTAIKKWADWDKK